MTLRRYSDDRGAASHRSGRLHTPSMGGGDAASGAGGTDAYDEDDDIEMNLETVFEGCVACGWPALLGEAVALH